MSSPKTRKREVDSLIECAEELCCDDLTIVTYNERFTITKGTHTVKVIPIVSL